MESRPSKHEYFMSLLSGLESRGTCPRRKVACIITDCEGQVLSMGYNGVPRGELHCTDVPCLGAKDPAGDTRRCMAVHAEQNALLQCQNLAAAYVMYVSAAPCFACAKMIANTPIRVVIARDPYPDGGAEQVLRLVSFQAVLAPVKKWRGHVELAYFEEGKPC